MADPEEKLRREVLQVLKKSRETVLGVLSDLRDNNPRLYKMVMELEDPLGPPPIHERDRKRAKAELAFLDLMEEWDKKFDLPSMDTLFVLSRYTNDFLRRCIH